MQDESEPRPDDDAPDPRPEDVNPEWPDPMPTESQVIAERSKAEYAQLPADDQARLQAQWDALPQWRKDDLMDDLEFDML